MATVHSGVDLSERRDVWYSRFPQGERDRQLGDDLEAGRNVGAVLVSVITVALLTMILTVAICLK